jgi:hypothetical protein
MNVRLLGVPGHILHRLLVAGGAKGCWVAKELASWALG